MKALYNYKLRLFLIILFSVSGAIVMKRAIYYGLKNYSDDHKKYVELFRADTYYDILLLGSSRMRNHLNPFIIDSITGYKSYNGGSEGANILEIKMIFDSYILAHPAPKLVVVNLDLFSLSIHKQYIGFYPKYLEFIDLPPVAALMRKNGVRVGVYKSFPFLETVEIDDYNRGNILKVAMHQHKLPSGDFFYKGYESNGSATLSVKEGNSSIPALVNMEPEAKLAFEKMVRACYEKNIRMILTYAPEYKQNDQKRISNLGEVINYYKMVGMSYGIPLIRNDSLELNDDATLFANIMHLNRKGASLYSIIFAHQIMAHGWVK